jgi:predicted oxidoreductase
MERKALSPNGPIMSRIIAGAWRWHLDESRVSTLIERALEVGITTFDHADIYGNHSNEKIFGNVVRKNKALRKRMEIITKFGIKYPSERNPDTWIKHYDTSQEHILWSVDNSLKMLGTDYIDVLLIHRPDPLMNPSEIAAAFDNLRQSGKVLHFGVSNFTSSQFEMLQHFMPFPLVTNQIEISPSYQVPLFDGSLDILQKHNVSPMGWSPLNGGKLATEPHELLIKKAKKYDSSVAQLCLAWLMKHPSDIFPVIGTSNPDRITNSAKSINVQLELQDWFDLLNLPQRKERSQIN